MSFWLFGQNSASHAVDLNKLLDAYYYKRSAVGQQQQPPPAPPPQQQQILHPEVAASSDTSQIQSEANSYADFKIDRNFVYSILDDPNLLQELSRQNNKLIDFICFGYIDYEAESSEDNTNDTTTNDSDENHTPSNNDKDADFHPQNSRTSTPALQQNQQGVPVLDLLVDLIVDSVEWFKKNQAYLFHASEDFNDEDIPHDEITDQFNRIHAASGILSCKIWLISESLVEEPSLLNKLWSFLKLELTNSLPSLQFFININEKLLESRPDQMLNFIRSQTTLVDDFLRHIDITMIMDFLLRIITTDKVDTPTGIIDMLSEQKLIPKLLDLLTPDYDPSIQSSCGDFLKALISISANTSIDEHTIGPNLLTKQLVSDQCVDKILDIMLQRGNGLSTVVGVIIEVIRKNNSDYDPVNLLYTTIESHPPNKRDPIYLGNMLKKISKRLGDFNDILNSEELSSKRLRIQIGEEIEPLGFERFKICELVAELLHCSYIGLLNNHMTEKIIEERENFLREQEDNLRSALTEEIENPNSKNHLNGGLNITNLNIGGTSEPSVALSSKIVTVSPTSQPMDLDGSSESPVEEADGMNDDSTLNSIANSPIKVSRKEQIRMNPTMGDFFKIQLIDSGILVSIIGMFTRFPWNNFWHNVVFDIVQQIFNGRFDVSYNAFLILELFDSCDITNLIVQSYRKCVEVEKTTQVRLGYMGHLILIAEEVVKFSSSFQNNKLNDEESDSFIYEKLIDGDWVDYVTNVLAETREMYNCVLGGIKTQEFQTNDYLNQNAIILGNSEEEILNQTEEPMSDVFYDSQEELDDRAEVLQKQ